VTESTSGLCRSDIFRTLSKSEKLIGDTGIGDGSSSGGIILIFGAR